MPIYKIQTDSKIQKIEERKFKLEKEVQNLTEANLDVIFNRVCQVRIPT